MSTVPSERRFILCSISGHYQSGRLSQGALHKGCHCGSRELIAAFPTTFRGMDRFNFVSLSSWKTTLILTRKNSWCEQLETWKAGHTVGLRFLAALNGLFSPCFKKASVRSLSSWDGCVWKDCSWLKSSCLGGSDVLWVWAGVRPPCLSSPHCEGCGT